jgi:hypothetical protein
MNRSDDDRLGGWYRALLLAYPAAYRGERGEEIVGTLLDGARPGQRWPSPREACGLVVGGLRSRVGAATHRPARDIWADGVQLAALVVLAVAVCRATWWFFWARESHDLVNAVTASWPPGWWRPPAVAGIAATVAAIVAIARGWAVAAVVLIPTGYLAKLLASVFLSGVQLSNGSLWSYHIGQSEQWLYVVAALAAVFMPGSGYGASPKPSRALGVGGGGTRRQA